MAAGSLHAAAAGAASGTGGAYSATISHDPATLERAASLAPTPFQHPGWLSAWYANMAAGPDVTPLIACVDDARTGAPAMVLPLVLRREGVLRVIEFADGGITDYNAPMPGPAAPRDAAAASAVWQALCRALPPADLIRFTKMPRRLGRAPNPLALLPGARTQKLCGNVLTIDQSWDDWHWSLERTFRKELERSWRVFQRYPDARFRRITDPAEAGRILSVLEAQQRARIHELGLPYGLDAPPVARFYRDLLARGLPDGYAVLTALTSEDAVVAALLGIRDGTSYAMVRLSTGGAAWKACSPGRLLIERTMAHMHEQGCRAFDFTIGSYAYKRRFGVTPILLMEYEQALSWRAMPLRARTHAVAAARTIRDRLRPRRR